MQFGDTQISDVTHNPKDPPDFHAKCDGREIGIELTELVDGEFFRKRDRARKNSEHYSAHSGEGLRDTQFDKQRFQDMLLTRISSKAGKYTKRDIKIDVLVVYTGEHWLTPEEVAQWLPDIKVERAPALKSIFFLMNYSPSYSQEHWPVFNIYGEP